MPSLFGGMSRVEPLGPPVHPVIIGWPREATRGAVRPFPAGHGISRETFYAVRTRVAKDGAAAAFGATVQASEGEAVEDHG